jgi:hypothetical protein
MTESQVIVDLPRKCVAVSVHPEQASWWRDDGLVRRFKIPNEAIPISVSTEQVSWWCVGGKLNKTSRLARKKARRRAGERVPMRYR